MTRRFAWPSFRDRPAPLSSRTRALALGGLVLAATAAAAATWAQSYSPYASAYPPPSTMGSYSPAEDASLRSTLAQWRQLQQSDSYGFSAYATFLEAHPGWPGEAAMRKTVERAIVRDATPAAEIVALFDRQPPQTPTGHLRYAEALAQLGRSADAQAQARAAWIGGMLMPDDESRLLGRFGGGLVQADQDARMEALLWAKATASAERQLPLVSPARRPLFAARLALQARTPGLTLDPAFAHDPGYIVDRAFYLRDTGRWGGVRAWLAEPMTLDGAPYDQAAWLQAMLQFGQAAYNDNQGSYAVGIAQKAALAYPAGTNVRDRPLAERDPYTSLVWLGGQAALKKLARFRDAEALFQQYAAAAATPFTQTRGLYWAGRAAQAAGDQATATSLYQTAAIHTDQFYGQLSSERLGRAVEIASDPLPVPLAPMQVQAFQGSEVVRAARLLGQMGDRQDQTLFLRHIATSAKTQADHQQAMELSRSLGRPDLGVMVARAARADVTDPVRSGFPTIVVPPAMEARWTMIHAISRQESQFDREATSRVGAKGLMQLMPATAREQSAKLGLPYEASRLTSDPQYNVMLGSAFFARMVDYYGGSIPLAVASYNAGPGNVNKFLKQNGDPRMGGVDWVDWIEAIPLQETRGYVQHVLENAVVYDLLNPDRARTPAMNRLSFYLGKSRAG